jgi:hypothetical protein
MLHNHPPTSFGAGTIGHLVDSVIVDTAPRQENNNNNNNNNNNKTPWPLVRERTIPIERPPLVEEI